MQPNKILFRLVCEIFNFLIIKFMKSTTIPKLVILLILIIFSNCSFSQQYTSGDIDLQYTFAHSYDTINCQSISEMSINVTINNSQINDTFKLINDSNYGEVIGRFVNNTGITPWNFIIDKNVTGYLYNSICDNNNFNTSYNTANFPWSPKKHILTHQNQKTEDTIIVYSFLDTFHYENPCGYNYATGRFYLDFNENCKFDSIDSGINPFKIFDYDDSEISSTCIDLEMFWEGFWKYRKLKKFKGKLKFFINPTYQFVFPKSNCSPVSYTIDTFPLSGDINELDFPLQCGSAIDLYSNCNGPRRARPNKPFEIYSSVGNIGCIEASGQLKLVLDPRVIYDTTGSVHPADTVLTSPTGDTLVWKFTNLNSFNKGPYWNAFLSTIKVTPLTTVSIGDTLHFKYWTNIPAQDADSSNNQGSFDVEIRTAFDPNEKSVSPKGEGPNGNISPTTQKLKYTIQFQNTGSDYAENIYVIDTLDAAIDPTSLRIEMASHKMNPEWLASNVVKFNFPSINLLDSTTNEPASHGSVTFNVHLKPNLPIGTQIKNIGYIYFDYNAPVLTNYAVSTLHEKSASINGIECSNGIVLYPNPAHVNISIQSSIELTVAKIISTDGKIVNEFDLKTNQKNLDISSLKIGTYIVEIESTTGYIQRLKFLKR